MLPLQQAYEVKQSNIEYLKATFRFKEKAVSDAFYNFIEESYNYIVHFFEFKVKRVSLKFKKSGSIYNPGIKTQGISLNNFSVEFCILKHTKIKSY